MSQTPRMTEQELTEFHRRVRISRMKKGKAKGQAGAILPCAPQKACEGITTHRSLSPSPQFIVHGRAMGKPRMTQQDKWKQRPAAMRYWAWCDLVRAAAGLSAPIILRQGVCLSAIFYLPCPASWSKVKRERLMGRPHLGKPDADNLVKGLMDALFVNDAFVWSITAQKYWDNRLGPHVVVRMEEGMS